MRNAAPYVPRPETRAALPFDDRALARAALRGELGELGRALWASGLRPSLLQRALGMARANRPEIETLEPKTPTTLAEGLGCLFVAGAPAPARLFRAAPRLAHLLLAYGFAKRAGTALAPRVSILPVGSRLILCELPSTREGRDLVAAPDLSALHLIDKIRNRSPRSWLDVATGTGVVVLAGRRAAAPSLGTDINDRALAFAQVSSWLNAMTAVRWQRCDLFGACNVGPRWHLVTCNPPLVEIEEGERDRDLPSYVAGPPGLFERFWREVPEWVCADGEVVTHSALPDDPEFPRSLGLRGAFRIFPFLLGGKDRFCITHWRPSGADGLKVEALLNPEHPHFGG